MTRSPGEAEPGQPVVPRTRLRDGTGQKRQNWVERASRAEAERDALAKRLEDAQQGPPPATAARRCEPIDPARDPEGYTRRVRGVVLNERLNTIRDDGARQARQRSRGRRDRPTSKSAPRPIQGCGTNSTPSRTRTQWMIENNATAQAARGNRHRSGGVSRRRLRREVGGRAEAPARRALAGCRDAAEPRERAEQRATGDEWVRRSAFTR